VLDQLMTLSFFDLRKNFAKPDSGQIWSHTNPFLTFLYWTNITLNGSAKENNGKEFCWRNNNAARKMEYRIWR
jgi:hypothetical protein